MATNLGCQKCGTATGLGRQVQLIKQVILHHLRPAEYVLPIRAKYPLDVSPESTLFENRNEKPCR